MGDISYPFDYIDTDGPDWIVILPLAFVAFLMLGM